MALARRTHEAFERCGEDDPPFATYRLQASSCKLHAASYTPQATSYRCEDDDPRCDQWARAGECGHNAYFMHSSCSKARQSRGEAVAACSLCVVACSLQLAACIWGL